VTPGLARPPRHGLAPVESVARLVGATPLVRLRRIGADLPGIRIYAKCEFANPGGSVKDRPALRMIETALADGRLGKGKTLVDSTSGNTGVAYAWICAALGIPCALVMPANVTEARKRIARAFGAELVFSDPLEGSDGAIRKVRALVEAEPDRWFYPDQYGNEENPRAHELGTAVEIAEALDGAVAAFAAGIGTGGTAMGTSRGLRRLAPGVRCFAVEPAEPLHGLEGLKHMASSIVPAIYREAELDGKLSMPTAEGWAMAERLGREEGLKVGHSAGAAVAGALSIARRMAQAGERGNVVTVLPDRADRYLEPRRWERRTRW
jgi:cysteine synthase B